MKSSRRMVLYRVAPQALTVFSEQILERRVVLVCT
jgi:hypothetical protein